MQSEVDLTAWSGPVLALGGPGTGKTTLVGAVASARVSAGGSPLVLAANRAAASTLRNRVALASTGTTQLTVTTAHALARSLLDQYGDAAGWRLLTAPEQEFRVRELLAGDGGSRWPEQFRSALRTRGFARQVRGALARARQLGLDPEDVAEFGATAGLPEWQALGEFFAEYLDVLDAEQVLDYAELVHRARLLLEAPDVLAAVRARFDAVVIDDVTDLDPAQLGLLRTLVPVGGDVLATADPQAAVNSFRGAHPRIAAEFPTIFPRADGSPARVDLLDQGFRAGGELAAALARVAARLPQGGAGGGAVPRPAPTSGTVTVLTTATATAEAAAIAAEIRRARLQRGIAYQDMAVLVRSGRAFLPMVARALAANGVPVDQAADEIALADDPAVGHLLLALRVVLDKEVSPEAVVRLFTSPLAGFDAMGLRGVVRQWHAAHQADGEGSGTARPAEAVLAEAVNSPGWLAGEAAPSTPGLRRLAGLTGLLASATAATDAGARPDEIAWLLWNGSTWPARLRAEALRGDPRADRDLDAVSAFFEVASEVEGGGAAGIRTLLGVVEAQQIPADRARESRLGSRGVQLMTAHRARGRQWRLVVVAGVQEGAWPAGRAVSALLEPERLVSEGIGPRRDARERLADERRLFYLACSRASEALVVTSSAGTEGEANQPSRFLAELGVEPAEPATGEPVTLGGFVGELRKVLIGIDEAPARREAAARELAVLAEARDDAGSSLVPRADPGSWWGVRELSSGPVPSEGPIRLSPSQVSSLLTCPRRYFLSRSAHAEGPVSVSASLGSVIHLVIQHADEAGFDELALGDHLDLAWQQLRFQTGWLSAVERVEAEAAIRRFLAWREARRLEAVGVEKQFEVQVEVDARQVTLSGTVDRLERLPDGRLAVVDFKTGRSVPTAREVAGMEQLGIYQLAIEAGGFGDLGDSAGGASVVYLRHPGRPDHLPKELAQDPLSLHPHLGDDPAETSYPTWVHHRVATAAAIVAEGCFDASPGAQCRTCPFADSCPVSGRGEQVLR